MTLVRIKYVSAYLDVKVSTLYALVRNGTIPAYKVGGSLRFKMEEVERVVEDSKITPPSVRTLEKKSSKNQDIDAIVKKAIEEEKPKVYTPPQRGYQTNPAQKGGKIGTL
jgi:excisionase family DNA binding protein